MISFIVLLVIFLYLSAYVSAVETALFSLSAFTLRSMKLGKEPKGRLIAAAMERPRETLVTLLMLNVLSNILIQNSVSSLFDAFPNWSLRVGVPLAITLVFGEVLPKAWALPNNQRIAFRTIQTVIWMNRILGPFRVYLTRLTSFISRCLFFFLREEAEISPEELGHVLKTSEASGILVPQECRLIEGALFLQRASVKELMRPREEILFYDIQKPKEELIHLFVEKKCSRLPVCKGGLENLVGILSADLYFSEGKKDLLTLLRKAYYAPETLKAWTLLWNLRERGEEVAIIVDEYGSITGLATQEDLIESMVGEIDDERTDTGLFTQSGEDVIIASGKLELSEFRDIFGIPLKTQKNSVTLGGFLIEELGDIPATGAKYETPDFFFYILAADPHRIRRVYVRRKRR